MATSRGTSSPTFLAGQLRLTHPTPHALPLWLVAPAAWLTPSPHGASRRISAANVAALREAMERGVRVIIATGKRPGPWLPPLRTALGFPDDGGRTLNAPSVLLNGLLVTAADGSVVHKQLLPREMVGRLLGFGEQHGLSTHVYAENRYCCQSHDEWSERVAVYEEGKLEAIGPAAFRALGEADGEEGTFKVVFWGAPEAILAARPHLDALAGDDGEVVSSLETALEVLPSGASKAAGMRAALELLGEGAGGVLALGDGENDLQSAPPILHVDLLSALRWCCCFCPCDPRACMADHTVGAAASALMLMLMLMLLAVLADVRAAGGDAVAMANAMPSVKAAASVVGPSNSDDGVGEAVRHFVFGEGSEAFQPAAKL